MKKAFSIIGILVSVAVIIMGITLGNEGVSSYVRDAEFGADFYTYIYSATRTSAMRIAENTIAMYKCFGFLLIALGSLSLCGFACNLNKEKSNAPQVTPVQTNEPLASIAPMKVHDDPDF